MDTTQPLIEEVRVAREAWVKNRPLNYTYSISDGGTITVVNGSAVSPKGAWTLEDHWRSILEANGRGELTVWRFSPDGVPLEWEFFEWEEVSPYVTHRSVLSFRRE